jgi:hypothetical protein
LRKETVPRDLERRLQAVEIEQADTITGVWIELSDGMIRGRRGETITRDALSRPKKRLRVIHLTLTRRWGLLSVPEKTSSGALAHPLKAGDHNAQDRARNNERAWQRRRYRRQRARWHRFHPTISITCPPHAYRTAAVERADTSSNKGIFA